MTRKQRGDQKRYDVLSRMLEDRQAEIQTKLRSLREDLPAELIEVKDAEEQSVEDFVRGMDFALMEMESQTLRKIDEAMSRLEHGSYGVCGECGTKIAEARLKALPFALLCRDCQEGQEERRANETSRHPALDEGFTPAPRERVTRGRSARASGRRWAGATPSI
jgi:DnaK suppressor protein